MKEKSTTIIAQASPSGIGGVSVIRISGSDALKLAKTLFVKDYNIIPRVASVCEIKADNIRDNALILYFSSPNSYTGEAVVEIHTHGNPVIVNKIISFIIKKGACLAKRGEFTRRAFFNKKLDLLNAEAVLDIINAKTEYQVNSSYNSLTGRVSDKIKGLQKNIIGVIASVSASLDYPDEDLEKVFLEEQKEIIKKQISILEALKSNYTKTAPLRHGVKVAIIGKPNVGKSSLFNSLLGFERAIVDSKAGTTRDTVEKSFIYKDIEFYLFDTAGIRESKNSVEKKGIERAEKIKLEADIILKISEAKSYNEQGNENNLEKNTIFVYNKVDLLKDENSLSAVDNLESFRKKKNLENSNGLDAINSKEKKGGNVIFVSAKTGKNIEGLKERLYNASVSFDVKNTEFMVNERQASAIINVKKVLKASLEKSITPDCFLSLLNEGYRILGEITGESTQEKIIEEIFEKFCVGK